MTCLFQQVTLCWDLFVTCIIIASLEISKRNMLISTSNIMSNWFVSLLYVLILLILLKIQLLCIFHQNQAANTELQERNETTIP